MVLENCSVAEAIISIIEAVGVDTCFGVPGGQTLPFYKVARERGFRHILMRDERNGACAADAYARVSGKVGFCDATVGPGVTNLVSGLAEAYASSIPVIALIADIRRDQEHLRHRGNVAQALEQSPMLEPVTKWIGRVNTAEMLADVMDHALRVATSGRAGPVVVEIPEDVMECSLAKLDISRFSPASADVNRNRGAAAEYQVAEVVDRLSKADKPIILAGGGALSSGAHKVIATLVNDFNIPVVTSINGKGIIEETHPLAFGVVGVFGNVAASHALNQADVVLVLGSKFGQFNSFSWQLPKHSQTVVHVDSDAEELGRAITAAVQVQADIDLFATQLVKALGDQSVSFDWMPQGQVADQPGTSDDDPSIAPEKVISMVNKVYDNKTLMVSDASLSSGWSAANFVVKKPGRVYMGPRGIAGLGWACGAAIGAVLATDGDSNVIAVAGDGAAAYWLGEIETAARLKLPITFLILNNGGFGWVVQCEREMGFPSESVFAPVDFATVGQGLGIEAVRVSKDNEIEAALAMARDCEGPFLIDVLSSDLSTPTVEYTLIEDSAAQGSGSYGI